VNKALVVEFVGPPGSGKTTNCRHFEEVLKKRGLEVFTLQDIKDYVRNMHFIQKTGLVLQFIFLRGHLFLYFSSCLIYNRIFNWNSLYRFIRLSLFNLALKQVKKKGYVDVVLLDQWMIQELWSATIFRTHSYRKLVRPLSKFYFHTDIVLYFNIDVITASERIGKRKSGRSRFDRLDKDRRVAELLKFDSYLSLLYQRSGCSEKLAYSSYERPEYNAALFASYLDNTFQYN
jgi:thymidylate kinase